MWKFWNYHGPVWKPEGEGAPGGGAGGADPGAGGAGAGDGGAPPAGAAPGAGEGEKPAGQSSILDFAQKGAAPAADGKPAAPGEWKAPEGLPDHLKGANPDETLAKVLTAYNGARRALAQKGQGEGGKPEGVPETPEGYEIKAEGADDKIAAELNSEASKPIVDGFRKAALNAGIPAKAFEQLMREGMTEAAKNGYLANDQDAAQISAEKEMEALTKLAGDPVLASTIVNTVENYGKRQLDAGLFTNDELQEFRVMCGTAESAALFYKIMTGELGEKPIPMGDPGAGEISQSDAYAMQAQALNMKPGAEREAALQRADKAMQKAFGMQASGAVRSNVL